MPPPILSVIIPAHNEQRTIQELISRVKSARLLGLDREIIIVDDCSTDNTRNIIQSIDGIKYFFHDHNQGKGGALKTGLKAATGDYVIFQDADLEYDPNDYQAMLDPILQGKAPWTNGVRIPPTVDPRQGTFHGWLNAVGNKIITLTTNWLYWHNAQEYEGCYRAFPRPLLNSLNIETNDFDFDNEIACKLLKQGLKPVDVPIRYTPRDYAAGKHINWRHGLKILRTIVKTRFLA